MARTILRNAARENYLEFLHSLYLHRYPLLPSTILKLEKAKLIGDRQQLEDAASRIAASQNPGRKKFLRPELISKNELEFKVDEDVVVVDASQGNFDEFEKLIRDVSTSEDLDEIKETGAISFKSGIKTSEWKVAKEFLMDHDDAFYDWINSINSGFEHRIPYWRFELYKAQAKEWLDDKTTILDFTQEGDQIAFVQREIARCRENSIYFLERYYVYKNKDVEGGWARYISKDAQQVIAFLLDSDYSVFFAKGRQIWSTTTIFGIILKRIMIYKSYFAKITTADDKKAVESFNEKLKEPYYALDSNIKPSTPSNDTMHMLSFFKDKKEQESGMSKATIEPAKVGAVNSGEPSMFCCDEVGMTDCLTGMVEEYKPTSMQYNHATGKMEQKNQAVLWGTSFVEKDGKMIDQSPDFEYEFKKSLERWEKKKFKRLIIPVFLNCFARPGLTQQLFDELEEEAFSEEGPNAEQVRIRFRKSYPRNIDDMFLTNPDTVIPIEKINAHVRRTNESDINHKMQWGFYTPMLDEKNKITGSEWNIVSSSTDYRAQCFQFRAPEKGWVDRYWPGSDPIANSSGHSNFANAIFDGLDNTISAGMAWRPSDHRDAFMQAMLQSIHYSPNGDWLIESNMGQNYIDYLDERGRLKNVLPNVALPRIFQIASGNIWGINNRTNTRPWIVNELIKMLELYADNIWTPRLFLELKTFIRKSKIGENDKFQVNDPRFNFDDFIFACAFAYINKCAHDHKTPRNMLEKKIKKPFYKLVMNKEFSLERKLVKG